MEKPLLEIYSILQKLVGLHRQLLEAVRTERDVLVQADLNGIQTATLSKQSIIEEIHHTEAQRIRQTGNLAIAWKKPFKDLTLPNIIIEIQSDDPKLADQLRTSFNALNVLIQRIVEQNNSNQSLIEKSLEHVYQMKKNVLHEASPQSSTYSPQGQKINKASASRLIATEV